MNILGISAFYHDSAAALVSDGYIVAAAQEERFTRRKQDPSYPAKAVAYCLRAGGLRVGDVDAVVFYEKPLRKAERLVETYLGVVPRDFAVLKSCLTAERGDIDYAAIARELQLLPASARSLVHRFRRRFREIFRAEVAGTVSSPGEVEDEMRALISTLG